MAQYCTEDNFIMDDSPETFGFLETDAPFPVPLSLGGTGSSTAAGARTNLGLGTAAVANLDTTLTVSDAAADAATVGLRIGKKQLQYLNTFYLPSSNNLSDRYIPVFDGVNNTLTFPSTVSVRGSTSNKTITAGTSLNISGAGNLVVWLDADGTLKCTANGAVTNDAFATILFLQLKQGMWYAHSASEFIFVGPVNTTVTQPSGQEIRDIAHRGYSVGNTIAPENTIPAFRAAAEQGFKWFECDLQKTSDNEWVILHDATINRTARNQDGTAISSTVNIADITLATAQSYVFCGSDALFSDFPTVTIPTLEETLEFASRTGLNIRLEFKTTLTSSEAKQIVKLVAKYGMDRHVEYHSSIFESLFYVARYVRNGMLSLLTSSATISSTSIDRLKQLSINNNQVGIAVPYNTTDTECENVTCYGFYVGIRNLNNNANILASPKCATAFTSDSKHASHILADAAVSKATTAIANGDYFMHNGRLLQATTAIAKDATITVGTNCVEISIADALNALS